MAIDPLFLMVKDRAQPELGLQAAEHGFKVRQQGIGAPHLLRIPASFIAAQTVDARMREAAAIDGLRAEVEGGSFFALGIRDQFDGVVLARAPALFLQAAKAFVEFGEALLAPGLGQTGCHFLQAGLKPLSKPPGDGVFLLARAAE